METIKPYVSEFYHFALEHPEYKFLITRIGSGIDGFTPEEIAPLFTNAIEQDNVVLPKDFVEVIQEKNSWIDSFDYWADRNAENY